MLYVAHNSPQNMPTLRCSKNPILLIQLCVPVLIPCFKCLESIDLLLELSFVYIMDK